ncbi:MAG TPA: MFS transporter, partial [Ferruginibacter sp.]|nr:MFS transporter [Ferruginibacter sp.]
MLQPVAKLYKDSYAGLSREIWLLSLVMLINRSGTMVLAFMTLYCRHLGFSTAEAGWVVSVYGLGSIAGAYLGGKLSDRIGFYPIQFSALFLGGICFILLGQMESYSNILIMTFLLSMVNESFRPANATAIAQYSTAQNRTQAFSLVRLAINLGWGVGSAIGGILASLDYHWLFLTDGITSMFASFLLLFLLPRPKRIGHEEPGLNVQAEPTQKAHHDKIFMRFLGLQVLFALCFFQLFTTVPMYLKEGLHLTEYNIGVLMALNGLMIALMEMILVFRLEGRYSYLRLMAFGTGMMAASYFLLNLTLIPSFILALLFIIIITIAEMIAMPFMNTYYISRSTAQNRGEYAGLYTMAWSLAQVIGSGSGAWLALLLGFKGLW